MTYENGQMSDRPSVCAVCNILRLRDGPTSMKLCMYILCIGGINSRKQSFEFRPLRRAGPPCTNLSRGGRDLMTRAPDRVIIIVSAMVRVLVMTNIVSDGDR